MLRSNVAACDAFRHRLVADRLRHGRRVRRRGPRRDPRHRARTSRSSTSPTRSRPSTCAPARSALARCITYVPSGVVMAVVDPGVGDRPPRGRDRSRRRPRASCVGPDNGLLAPAVAMAGGAERAVELDESRLPAADAGRDVRRPRRVRARGRPHLQWRRAGRARPRGRHDVAVAGDRSAPAGGRRRDRRRGALGRPLR